MSQFAPRFAACLLAALLGLGPAIAPAQEQQPDEVKTATHGAWDVICADGDAERCVIRQLGKNSEGNDVLVVTVRKLSDVTADNGEPVPAAIDIIAPLGVALRAGVRVKVDGGQDRGAPFDICLASGCLVRSPVGDDFLAALKGGNSATMTVVAPQQGEVAINVSLIGFTAAFNALR